MDVLISVIIPTYNEARSLGAVLGQFGRLPGRWEVIVADSGSTDGTLDIARDAGVAVVEEAPLGRGAAMNAGAARAAGAILLFLHADTLLPDSAHRLIVSALGRPDVAGTGFRLRMDRREWRYRLLTPIATLRFRVQRTFFGDQAIAVRRRDFERAGGFHEPVLMEDVDLSRRLRKQGRLVLLPEHVVTSARMFERHGVFRTLIFMSALQAAYALGVSAERLIRWYGQAAAPDRPARAGARTVDIATLTFEDEEGNAVTLSEAGSGLLLVFLRWLG